MRTKKIAHKTAKMGLEPTAPTYETLVTTKSVITSDDEGGDDDTEIENETAVVPADAPAVPTDNDNNNTPNNAANASTSTTTWPPSACERLTEFEEQLRCAPAVDMIRIAMVVGFACLHSNHLDIEARRAWHVELCRYLRIKGYLRLYNRDIEPHIVSTLWHQNHALHTMMYQASIQHQQQQQQQSWMQQQARAAAAAAATTIKGKSVAKKKPVPTKYKIGSAENPYNAPETFYNGPAENIQGCPPLEGWTKKSVQRSNTGGQKRVDHYWYTPKMNCVLRSKPEIQRWFQYYQDPNDECYQDERKAADKSKRNPNPYRKKDGPAAGDFNNAGATGNPPPAGDNNAEESGETTATTANDQEEITAVATTTATEETATAEIVAEAVDDAAAAAAPCPNDAAETAAPSQETLPDPPAEEEMGEAQEETPSDDEQGEQQQQQQEMQQASSWGDELAGGP